MIEDLPKQFKILSIDGGGIKGLYSSTILEHLEAKFNCACSDYFDLICGTSTGGLIALALSLKIPAKTISKFYCEEGPKIFRNKSSRISFLKQVFLGGKYSDRQLKISLQSIFGEKKLSESSNLLCIPAYSITDARPWVFKYDHSNLSRDNKALYIDVALATTAAPTYFPLAEISYYDSKQFVDGGVWANNPTLCGLIEALSYFAVPSMGFNNIQILSVSSLNNTGGKPTGLRRKRSFRSWGNDLFETSLIGQSSFTDYFLTKLKNLSHIPITYVRIPSEQVSSEQEHLVKLDSSSQNAINFIRGKGNDRGYLSEKDINIQSFFSNQKIHKIN